jgi:hypothetical protein
MQISEVDPDTHTKIAELVRDARAASLAYEKYAAEKMSFAKNNKRRFITARLNLLEKISCMYETYRIRDFKCPPELEKHVIAIKQQAFIIENSLQSEEVDAAEVVMCEVFISLRDTLEVLSQKMDISYDPPEENPKETIPGDIVDIILKPLGIMRK